MTCNCGMCQNARRIASILASRDPDRLIALVKELQDSLMHSEMDVDRYDAIMLGVWPSAKEILTKALEKCK